MKKTIFIPLLMFLVSGAFTLAHAQVPVAGKDYIEIRIADADVGNILGAGHPRHVRLALSCWGRAGRTARG